MTQFNLYAKVLRGTARAGSKKSGICIIRAWVAEQQLVLGKETVAAMSNE